MLELKKIKYSYSLIDNTPRFFLGPVNLKIEKGELVSLLGPNGSGKSTLMKLITGIIKPLEGEILVESESYSNIKARELARKIAFVPQNPSSVYPFTIYEIVMMGRTPYLNYFGYENNIDCEIVEEALNNVDIYPLRDKPVTQVSGGEIQRAFIARALAQQAPLVLLDEPNSHLDIRHQIDLFNLIDRLNKENGITFVSVSHDINLAAHYFGRAVLLKNGMVVFDGNNREVINSDNIKSVFEVDSKIYYDSDTNRMNVSFLN